LFLDELILVEILGYIETVDAFNTCSVSFDRLLFKLFTALGLYLSTLRFGFAAILIELVALCFEFPILPKINSQETSNEVLIVTEVTQDNRDG